MRISLAKKAISDYRKVAVSTADIVAPMLTYVEAGISFSVQFGYSVGPLYSSVLSVFGNAMKLVCKEELSGVFSTWVGQIVADSPDNYCWFEDELTMIYEKLF